MLKIEYLFVFCFRIFSNLKIFIDDGNKSYKCTECGYYVWKHGDTIKKCYFTYCLDGDSESEYDLQYNLNYFFLFLYFSNSNIVIATSSMNNPAQPTLSMQTTSASTNKSTIDKKDPMDIDVIIDKIDKMPIPDADKAMFLNQIKQNMMNPSRGEDENLNRIQSKYMNPEIFPLQTSQSSLHTSPYYQSPPIPPLNLVSANPLGYGGYPLQQSPMQQAMQQAMIPQMPSNLMTTVHFEILKNKIDSVQLELVDLLRHVKDYTQRYMNATRQQDMEKIDAYINGLFEVDKKMKEADAKAAEYEANPEKEEEPATRQSIISKATSGIKNFIGSIGDNVAGLATMATNTANIANGYLSKKVISGNTSNTSPQVATKPELNKTGSNTNNVGKNIVSVDDYMNSTLESTESNMSITPTNIITANSNDINKLKTTNPSSQPIPEKNKNVANTESTETSENDITKAINKLNDSMNEDINNTIKEGNKQINTTTPTTATATEPVQSGGKHEYRLTKKIKLLRLKLTKNKLQRKLQNELQIGVQKGGHLNKLKTISQNKNYSFGKKYSMKKTKDTTT